MKFLLGCFWSLALVIGCTFSYAVEYDVKVFEKEVNAVKTPKQTIYQPTWDSLDSRPLPDWFDFSKLGIFIHWGSFAVAGFGAAPSWGWYYWRGQNRSDWVNFMKDNYKPGFTYPDFASQFTAEFYNPDDWADLFKAAGAKYMVLTSKHHEGYCNWPTNVSWNWNSMDVGPHRDLVGDLAKSIRKRTDLHFGLYHSLFEFFNPIYLQDKANQFKTNNFVSQKTMPELYELVNAYKPDVIWSDGAWDAESSYWNSTEFLAWLYNKSPVKDTVVTNDRWGSETPCKNGGFFSCDDRYNPGVLQKRKWENAMTLNKISWGWQRNTKISDFLSTKEMIQTFVTTISCGGNMLMNVGPTKAGIINPILQERLMEMGEWLSIYGEAVYGSKPWRAQNDSINSNVWYTCQPDRHVHLKAKQTTLKLKSIREEQDLNKSQNTKAKPLSEAEEKWRSHFYSNRAKPNNIDLSSSASFPIFAFILEWPESNVLLLGEPTNGTEASRVIFLGAEEPWLNLQWTSMGEKGIAVEMPNIPISKIPHKHVWVLGLYGFD